ncbi:MAG: hypothetical protein JXB50_12920 [Spirochaetes bacterium]|nr:hypothetical protein [Spirochaetota bacterium]
MIKKVLFLILVMSNFIFLYGYENIKDLGNDMFFYIPEEDHIKDYFNFYDYLLRWDQNKISISEEKLFKFYKEFVGQKTLHGLLFEAFLRHTRNPVIRRQVLLMLKGNNIDDVFSRILTRLYNSRVKKVKMQNIDQLQYSFKDEYFDENINLFNQKEMLFFDNELGLMLFNNPWVKTEYKRTDEKEINKDGFYLNYRGETNSLGIYFYKFTDISFEEFNNKVIYSKYSFERFNYHGKVKELEKSGILKKSNADKIFLNYGFGVNDWHSGENILFTLFLYSEKHQRGYSVSYCMNFLKNNNNYEMRHRIWNQLMMQFLFCNININ